MRENVLHVGFSERWNVSQQHFFLKNPDRIQERETKDSWCVASCGLIWCDKVVPGYWTIPTLRIFYDHRSNDAMTIPEREYIWNDTMKPSIIWKERNTPDIWWFFVQVGFKEELAEVFHEPCTLIDGAVPDWLEGRVNVPKTFHTFVVFFFEKENKNISVFLFLVLSLFVFWHLFYFCSE